MEDLVKGEERGAFGSEPNSLCSDTSGGAAFRHFWTDTQQSAIDASLGPRALSMLVLP